MDRQARNQFFMQEALEWARRGALHNEIPVGAVLVYENEIIAANHNLTETLCDPTAHAEILVLREGAQLLGNHRLLGAQLFVTLEPCAMCAGALVHARIAQLHYATSDLKTGAVGSVFQLVETPLVNHQVAVHAGLGEEESRLLLQAFFLKRRKEHPHQG